MTLTELEAELFARQPESDMVPTLDRVARVMELLGDPQRSFRVVHVTGTNGKSSTARMIDVLVRSTGLRTGLFTSPHLHSVTERIVIDGSPLSDEEFMASYADVSPYIAMIDQQLEIDGEPTLTFFETLTCVAYAAFADAPVEVAIVEVGLGGRWDATNVADADVAVVTPISLDHTEWLGKDVAHIAAEKGGIIKPGSVAVIGGQSEAASGVLLARCIEVGVEPILEGPAFGVRDRTLALGGQMIDFQGLRGEYDQVFLPLFGQHQAENAALAIAAVEALLSSDRPLSAEMLNGFELVASPARMEIVQNNPTVIVDAAHNPSGARALVAGLVESFQLDGVVGVVAVMADKDIQGILTAIRPGMDRVVFTRNASDRSAAPEELLRIAGEAGLWPEGSVTVAPDLTSALEIATEMARVGASGKTSTGSRPGRVAVVATGSVVTAAEARAALGAPPVMAAPAIATIEAQVADDLLPDEDLSMVDSHDVSDPYGREGMDA